MHSVAPVDDGAVIFVAASQRFLDLNSSALALLELIAAAGWSTEDAAEALSASSVLDATTSGEVLESFLADLQAAGFPV